MKTFQRLSVLIALLASLACAGAASANTFTLQPSSSISYAWDVKATNTDPILSAFFNILFDTTLTYSGWESDYLNKDTDLFITNPPANSPISFAFFDISGSFPIFNNDTLATISFSLNGTGNPVAPLIYDEQVITYNTTPVPEPSTILMLFAGIAGLFAARRRLAG